MINLSLRRLVLTMLLVILPVGLGGCLSSAPATRLYLLAPITEVSAATVGKAQPLVVIVREVRVPHYLDRPQIVTRGSGQRLLISEFDQWGGDLREDLTRILAANLGHLLNSQYILAAPTPVALQPDYRIDVEVLRFERAADGKVWLGARWWLLAGKDAAVLASREAILTTTQAGDGTEALVAAMSKAYGELAREIAAEIRNTSGT